MTTTTTTTTKSTRTAANSAAATTSSFQKRGRRRTRRRGEDEECSKTTGGLAFISAVAYLSYCLLLPLPGLLLIPCDSFSFDLLPRRDKRRSRTPPKVASCSFLEGQYDPLPPRSSSGCVRIVFLSDTHGRHGDLPPLPDGDVLIHLGDAVDRGSLSDARSFVDWLGGKPHPQKIIVDGNHDRDRSRPDRVDLARECLQSGATDVSVLRDEAVFAAGGRIKVYGASWESCESDDYEAAYVELERRSNSGHVDILLTHMNPYVEGGGHGWRGSAALTNLVRDAAVPLHCFGHVHHGRGIRRLDGGSVMVNCATAWGRSVVVDYCPDDRRVMMVHCPVPDYVRAGKAVARTISKV